MTKRKSRSERIKLYLSVPWNIPRSRSDLGLPETNFLYVVNNTRATVLVGDNFYHDIWFPREELEKGYTSLLNKPMKLNHTDDIMYEIGYGYDPRYSNGRISVQPVIVPETKYAETALGWIKCRHDAGQVPEVSVEVWTSQAKETIDDGEVMVARDLEFEGFALVSKGACSPETGCGIGMGLNNAVSRYCVDGEEWIPLGEIDNAEWGTGYINSLPNMAFAAVESCASEKKTARHLPHHNKDVKSAVENSSVDLPHLRNALARVNQIKAVCEGTDIEALKRKAHKHLLTHARALGVGEQEIEQLIERNSLEDKQDMTKKEKETKDKLAEEPGEEPEPGLEPGQDELRLSLEKEIEELKTKQVDCVKQNKELVLERDTLNGSLEEKTGELETLKERVMELEKEIQDLSKPRQKGLNGDTSKNPVDEYYQAMRRKMGLGKEK